MNKWKKIIFPSILAVVGVFVWKNTLNNQFLYDDDTFIVLNDNIRSLAPITKFFSPDVSSNNSQMNRDVWRPLTTFSNALNYKLSGLNPKSFHLVNLAIHLINGLLVFWLVLLIAAGGHSPPAACRLPSADLPLITAFIAALVFLIHPVQAETVAWVSQRSNILFLAFYLLAFISFLKTPSGFSTAAFSWRLLCVFLFALSLLCKEMAASLPFLLVGYLWLVRREKPAAVVFETFPFFLTLLVFVLARKLALGQLAQTGYWAGGFIPQMLTMVKGFAIYVKLMFVPYPLSVEYLFPVKRFIDLEVLFHGAMLLFMLYAAFRLRKRHPLASFGVFLFFIALGPVSNIIPMRTIINERFLYLPVIGFGLILGKLVGGAVGKGQAVTGKKLLAVLPFIALFMICTFITINRIGDWHDHIVFVTAGLKTCPQSATLRYGMGRAYASKGMFEDAAKEFELALKIDPQYAEATADLGRIAAKTGNIDAAIARYRESVQKRVDFFEGLHNLGVAYFNKGDYREAAATLEKAVDAKPGDLEARTNLAAACAYSGGLDKAIGLSTAVLSENPGMHKARFNLALFYNAAGMPEKAMEQYRRIVAASGPGDALRAKAGQALSDLRKLPAAAGHRPSVRLRRTVAVSAPRLTQYIREKFPFPEVADSLERASGAGFARTREGITLEKGWPGSAMAEAGPKPEEIQALEALRKRDKAASDGDGGVPAFIFSPDIKNGYAIDFRGSRLSVKHAAARRGGELFAVAGASLTAEPGALVYENAYPETDILYVLSGEQSQEMLLLKSGESPGEFIYEYSQKPEINPAGEIAVNGLTLSKPVVFDASGRRTEGKWEIAAVADGSSPVGGHLVRLSFDHSGLNYPILIDPAWRATGSMSSTRRYLTVTLLPSGKVLVAGGWKGGDGDTHLSTAELYDPSAGTFAATGSMSTPRALHTATLLPDGKVLIVGGQWQHNVADTELSTADLYDPDGAGGAGSFSAPGPMSATRACHTATLLANGKVLIAGGTSGGVGLSTAELYNPAAGSFSPTGPMLSARYQHTATLLPDGNVLMAAGHTGSAVIATAELYNPAGAGSFATTGSMLTARFCHQATLLATGKVLVAGGYTGSAAIATAQLYDPAAGTFATTGSMLSARYQHTATLLPGGKVLMAGGYGTDGYSTAELYDPAGAGSFSATGSMLTTMRYGHSAALLPGGQVLVVGGWGTATSLSTAQLYDPSAGAFSDVTGPMVTGRCDHTATLLPSGKVLIAAGKRGGVSDGSSTAELYDPAAGTFSSTDNLLSYRRQHGATLLPNGKVLVTGGFQYPGSYVALSTAELYDPAGAGTFSATGSMLTVRFCHPATLLPNGKVLIAGGHNGSAAIAAAELYNPATSSFSATGPMLSVKFAHTATLLPNGKVLIAGGHNGSAAIAAAELYDPASGSFSTTSSMLSARHQHTATLLPNGKVLVAGGATTVAIAAAELYDPATGSFSATGSMNAARRLYTATLLPNGKVLMAGGYTTVSTAELYDPAVGSFSTTGSMKRVRYQHTATLLPGGKVLMAGTYDSATNYPAELVNYTEYDYSAVASVMQPEITTIAGSSSFPVTLRKGRTYAITGQRFKGYSEAGSGYWQSSPTNYPRVYLQKLDTGGIATEGGYLINVSTSVYPISSWQDADTGVSFKIPVTLPSGYWMVSVMANAIPSDAKIVAVVNPVTRVKTGDGPLEWQWREAVEGDYIPSGTPNDWQWRQWQQGSGRQIPEGTADDWSWIDE